MACECMDGWCVCGCFHADTKHIINKFPRVLHARSHSPFNTARQVTKPMQTLTSTQVKVLPSCCTREVFLVGTVFCFLLQCPLAALSGLAVAIEPARLGNKRGGTGATGPLP